MRATILSLAVLVAAGVASAAPPELKLTDRTAPNSRWVTVVAETAGRVVEFVPLTPGLDPFPLPLADPKAFVALAPAAGEYRILAYTAVGDEPSKPVTITVRVGPPPAPPPVNPPPTPDPGQPGQPAEGLYFFVVRPTGPASPEFTKAMSLPEWATLRAAGHRVKDFDPARTTALLGAGVVPAGTPLPVVVTLRETTGGSAVVRGPVPLPTTGAGVLDLTKGVTP